MKPNKSNLTGKISGLFGILAALLVSASHAESMLPTGPSASELAVLPDYCRVRLHDEPHSPEYQDWENRLGHKFMGIHHYCFGLNYINRYFTTQDSRLRKYYLSRVLPEMDYEMKDMPDSFPLAGEMYLNHGYAHSLMGDKAAAGADYAKAVEISPKLAQAYYRLIEYYVDAKNRTKALEVAGKGLSYLPDSKVLQKKYLQLGGKEPFPKPVDDAPAMVSRDVAPADANAKPDAAPAAASQSAGENAGKDAKAGNADSAASKPAPIGEPGNPYCRFCP